ncbi:MAG TPA: M20 family metallo-hydrolase, partial [Thermoleophilia bacterium]|nr:M20 family metallo-hydrolase [Thermoleophilia bacterium]
MVAFQRSLTAIRALGPENGGEGEWERSRFLLDQARRFGFTDIVEVDAEDERVPGGRRPNLILRVPGRSAHPAVWVMAHMDTVPPGETALWDSDPFVAEVCDGRIVGRGVEDNQQGLVAGLFALRALLDEGVTPTTDVRLLLVADEETGNARGVDHVLETRPALFDPSDLVIVPDAGAPDGAVLEIAEKSALWIRLAVRGKQVHASVPQAGVNAHRAAAHLVVRLDRRLHQVFDAEDGLFEPPGSTFEPTKREANVQNVNTIPGEDVLYFDCRILPRYGLAAVKAEVEEEAREIAAEFGVRVDVSYPT